MQKFTKDVTREFEMMEAELRNIRVTLGLEPRHDPTWAVKLLYEEGREAFERTRGPACETSGDWRPRRQF